LFWLIFQNLYYMQDLIFIFFTLFNICHANA